MVSHVNTTVWSWSCMIIHESLMLLRPFKFREQQGNMATPRQQVIREISVCGWGWKWRVVDLSRFPHLWMICVTPTNKCVSENVLMQTFLACHFWHTDCWLINIWPMDLQACDRLGLTLLLVPSVWDPPLIHRTEVFALKSTAGLLITACFEPQSKRDAALGSVESRRVTEWTNCQ